ncbi:MAG: Lrp/AsnC family transcriptional regulator [Acidiferrobacterales bacterium]|nr:Lrp/AsnC family transcriptional regulator [Acidiferrobacterales bacterium]
MRRELTGLERRLLNEYQREFPLCSRPFAEIAGHLGISEVETIDALKALNEGGVVSRVGPVFRPHRIGTSTLAAMAVPSTRLDEVADIINGYTEVNHNYEREHRYNLWFVATANNETQLKLVLCDIERRSGLPILRLPMLDDYHIDLGFDLQWEPGESNAVP